MSRWPRSNTNYLYCEDARFQEFGVLREHLSVLGSARNFDWAVKFLTVLSNRQNN